MANGYLGKISAIVSANTADFDGKLSKSAKEVSSFARSVQSNLTSASRQAARSLEGIYTPLQKFERSLQAAASMKLSFKGFPGMIKDLDGLQQRLNSVLSKRQVDIVLKTTGMSSVSALRDAISGLKSKDIELIARVGGIDKLKELGGKITADVDIKAAQDEIVRLTALAEAAKAKVASIGSAPVTVKVKAEGIDALKADLDSARAAAGKLMGGEFMGDKSLKNAISSTSGELVNLQAELGRAKAARDTLATMASGSRSKPEELNSANARVSSLAGQEQQLSKRLADLEKYRDTIKKLMRDIKQAEAGGGGAAAGGGGDIAQANKEKAAAVLAVTKATKDLQKQLAAKFGVDIDITSLTTLIEKANTAGGVINNLDALIENLGKSDFDAAADSMRKLQSASSQIFEPLAASVKKLAGLGVEFQTPFHEALKATQADVERLKVAIDAVGDDGPSPELLAFFAEVQAKSDGATKAIDRMVEVTERLGQLKTGKEFVFEQPRLNEAINKGGDIGNRAAALPAEALRTNPAFAQSLVDIRRLSDEAGVAYAKFLTVKDQKQPTGEAQKELDAVVKKLLEAQAVAEKEIKVVLDVAEAERKATELKAKITSLKQDVTFTVTGKVQNFEQARGEMSRLQAEMGKLDATQRAPIARRIVALGKLVEAGDVNSLETVRNLIQQIEKAVGKKLRVSLDKAQAQRAADELAASLAKFKESISFTITGKVQNLEQARAELGRLQSDVDKLTEPQKIAIAPQLQKLGELVAGNQIKDLEQARKLIADIATEAGSAIKLNLDTTEADAKATELKAKIVALKENVTFTVTGKVQNIDQARSELARLQGDLGKLDESQRKPIAGNLVKLGKLIDSNDVTSLDAIRKVIAQIKNTIGKKLSVNLKTDQAKKAAEELTVSLAKFKESISFTITGKVQNLEQARSELGRLQSDVDKLTESQKIAIEPKLQKLGELVAGNQIKDLEQVRKLIADIVAQAGSDTKFNLDTDEAEQKTKALRAKIVALKENVTFTVTGKVQNFDQARGEMSRLQAEMGKLDATQRAPIARKIVALGKLVDTGEIKSLDDVRVLIERIEKAVGKKLRLNIDKSNLDKLKESISFTITGKVQNVEQARVELGRLQSDVNKLTESQRITIAPKLQALGELVSPDKITDLEQARKLIADITALAGDSIQVNLNTSDADKKATELKSRLDALREEVRFTVTGGFSNAGQIEAEVSRVNADIQKLDDTQKAAFGQRATLVIGLLGDNKIQEAAIEVKNLRSDLDQQMELKVTTDAAQKAVDDFKAKMDRVREQNAFVITDRPQNMEQAESRESSLRGEVGQLDGSRRAKFRGLLEDAAVARDTGELDKYNVALDKITIKLASEKKLVIDDKKAQDSLDAINRELRSLADALGPPAGMDRLKESTQAADAAVEKLAAGLDKARLKTDIGQLRVDLGAAEMLPAGPAKDQAIADISTRAESITQDAGVVAGNADSVEKARARITSLNDAWAQAVRGLPETEAKADAFFTGIVADIGKLDLADRISLDPIIGEIIALIQTGAGISTVTARMLELEAATNELASAGKVSTAIEKLSPTAARDDLEARLAAAKAAATSPIPLATPGETVENVGRETELRGSLGKDLADSSRGLDLLKGGITSLKGQIDALPEGVRSRFIPAIRDAENEFVRLSTSSSALPGQIDAARQRVQQLAAEASRATQAMNFSQSFGGAGAAGLNLGLDQRSLQGYTAQMQILQGAIARGSAEARGPAVAAFERFRNAVSTAFDEGTIDSRAMRAQLAALRTEAVAAAAAAGGVRVGTLTREVSRAGDVGRAGFDRFGLALNQAGYAIDDFMSSTGGLEFKLRAVSNNITQLAFILGGTTGLFVGLGAVIAGQAAVALIKFMNSGRSAEDQTKALNDALAKQKSLVDGLAESHKALADAILRGTTSGSSESSRTIVSRQADLRRQSAELSSERKATADTAPLAPQSISRMIGEFLEPRQRRNEFQGVAEIRAELNKLEKQLQAATTVGERATIQGRIRDTGRAELATRGRLASEQTPDATVVQSAIRGSANSSERASSGTFGDSIAPNDPARNRTGFGRVNSQRAFSDIITLGGARLIGINRTRAAQQNAANEGLRGLAAQGPTSVQGQIEALRKAQELKRPEQAQADYGFVRTSAALDADREIAKFEAMIQSLQKVMESGIVDSAAKTYAASVDAANSIRAAQEDVADAIKRGVPSALAFQAELDKLSSELAAADDELRTAVTASPDDPNITPERREAAIKRAQERLESVNRQRADVESRAREVRLGRTFGGERTTKALSSLEGNDRFANEQAGMLASLKRVIDDEVQARRKASEAAGREAAIVDLIAKKRTEVANSGSDINKRLIAEADIEAAQADLEKAKAAREAAAAASDLAQKASEAAAALAEAAAGIEAALTRVRKIGDSALQRSEQGADAAQKAFEENPLQAGGREARDAAERRLINDRATVGNAQADLDNRRREIQSDPQIQAITGEMEAVKQRREDLTAKSKTAGGLNPAENTELDTATKRYIELVRRLELATSDLTDADRKQKDIINNGIIAREKELDALRRKAEQDPAFDRRREAAGAIAEGARQQADEAQQRYINNPTDENKKRRDEADQRYREDRKMAEGLQDGLDAKRKEMQKDPRVVAIEKEMKVNNERLAALAEKEARGGLTRDEREERKNIQGRNRDIRGERDAIIDNGTRKEQGAIDDAQIAQNQRDRAIRGRDLGMTDKERFRKEFEEGAGADINARAKEMRDKGEDPTKFLKQAITNQLESVAPMRQQLQNERENDLRKGPSRAALQSSDVTTTQGKNELNRLLRGDDSARDNVNLAELKKQTEKFNELIDTIKKANPKVLL